MSDEKLRELERRFRETGSEEDEVAWLRERARVGEKLDWESYSRLSGLDTEAAASYLSARVEAQALTGKWLRAAALVGHRPAGSTCSSPGSYEEFLDCLHALNGLDPRLAVMAVLSVSEAVDPCPPLLTEVAEVLENWSRTWRSESDPSAGGQDLRNCLNRLSSGEDPGLGAARPVDLAAGALYGAWKLQRFGWDSLPPQSLRIMARAARDPQVLGLLGKGVDYFVRKLLAEETAQSAASWGL